jgi:chloride channel 3/4/5
LTKKDLWYVLNEGEDGRIGSGIGVLREEVTGQEDERGLLNRRGSDEGFPEDRDISDATAVRN